MENNNVVYKHTNLENGLVYYGIAENYVTRWNDGFGYQTNQRFWKDIVKYGWKNFKHEILVENLTRDEARFYEGMLIQETGSYLPENGYNQNLGEHMNYREVTPDDIRDDIVKTQRPRTGRAGTPVVCNGKTYLTIAELSEEINEDAGVLAQMLSPACTRKMSKIYEDMGLRYATEDEILACVNERMEREILG